jgi:competence protein ComGC
MNPQNPPYPAAPSEGSGLAVASLVLGILGIVLCLGPLAGVPAVICGHIAQSRIKRAGGASGGMVIAGLITGYISIAMTLVIGLLAAVAIPNFVKARRQAQYQVCHSNLKMIQQAKETWALENRKTEDAVPTEADLLEKQWISSNSMTCPAHGRYEFNSVKDNPVCNVHGTLASASNR